MGDAVFGYARDARLLRGETLLELIESTYTAFRGRTKNVRRHSTCDCRACNNISTLDMKFIVHHGDFAMQNIGGRKATALDAEILIIRYVKAVLAVEGRSA